MPAVKVFIYSHRFIIRKGFECLLKENFNIPLSVITDNEQLLALEKEIQPVILIWDRDIFSQKFFDMLKQNQKISIIAIGRPKEEFIKKLDDFFPLRAEASYIINRLKYHIEKYSYPNDANKAEEGKLTEREEEIVRLIALGYTSQQIAEILSISPNTVITHRKNISAKLGIKTISGLTIYAILNGLVSIDEVKNILK